MFGGKVRRGYRGLFATALACLAAAAVARPTAAGAAEADWRTFSDVAAGALLVGAVAVPLIDGDRDGTWQALGSLAAVSLVTEGLKAVVHERRPDGSGDDSFPSGHTARAFAAAATLAVRRGPAVGGPALALAGLVGVARVEGRKHAWTDVAAGAALGGAAALALTEPRPRAPDGGAQARLLPLLSRAGGGLALVARF